MLEAVRLEEAWARSSGKGQAGGCSRGGMTQRACKLVQGFCELKYSEAVARHAPVGAARAGAGFVSGRTTAVLPADAPNLFGIGSI